MEPHPDATVANSPLLANVCTYWDESLANIEFLVSNMEPQNARQRDMYDKVDKKHVKCKECGTTLRLYTITRNPQQHLRKCYRIKAKLSLWDKYEKVDEVHMKCKQCGTNIELHKDTSLLGKHFAHCRIFKNYDPIKLKNSSLWDKFDEKYMRCKGCKKLIQKYTISIKKLKSHCCPSNTSSELMKKNDFHGKELQEQTTVQSILQKLRPIKPKREETEKSDGSAETSPKLMKNATVQTKVLRKKPLKPKGQKAEKSDGSAEASSKLMKDATVQTKALRKFKPLKPKGQKAEKNDGSYSTTKSKKVREALIKSKTETKTIRTSKEIITDVTEVYTYRSDLSSDSDEGSSKVLKKSKGETLIQDQSRQGTNIDVHVPSTSRSTGNGFHDTV